MTDRIIHGRTLSIIEGESPQARASRMADFTAAHYDNMTAAVMNGQAETMAFLHEDGYILAVTEGVRHPQQPLCAFCGANCQKEAIYDELAELAEELGENSELDNKGRRFELYRLANRLVSGGGRGKGNRVELPGCITAEIHDFFPPGRDDDPYVGFRDN